MITIAVSAAVVAAKAAVAIITDEKARTAVFSIIVGIIAVIVFGGAMIAGVLTATANQNEAYLTSLFTEDAHPPPGLLPEDAIVFDNLKLAFSQLDNEIAAQNDGSDEGQIDICLTQQDVVFVKAVFLSLWPRADYPELNYEFLESFVSYFVDFGDEAALYAQLETLLGREITDSEQDYADSVYRFILYGEVTQFIDFGLGGASWNDNLPAIPGGFAPPIAGDDWQKHITSGFGQRTDPITGKHKTTHTGVDFGLPVGTSIYAAKAGTVLFVEYQTTGYGYHVAIDHGGGVVTMYCHTSKIYVTEGQDISQGQVIAEVGSTGKSTGPHLHFEIRVNSSPVNPMSYLP